MERTGRITGVAEHKGDPITFWALDDVTKQPMVERDHPELDVTV